MRKKLGFIILIIIVSVFAISVLASSKDTEIFQKTFDLDAIYYEEQKIVKITFNDNSQKTNSVTLEVLGLAESFQKTYLGSSFEEVLLFENVPKHGWKIHPVILAIDHQELGRVELKTEIHSISEPKKPIIYSTQ